MSKPDDLKAWSKNDLIREVAKLRHLLSEQLASAPETGPSVVVQGLVSSTTKQPFIQMRAGEAAWQMTPAQTRQHALILLDAAVEAERDAATIAYLEKDLKMGENEAGMFLHLMREHRKDWFEEFRSLDSVVPDGQGE